MSVAIIVFVRKPELGKVKTRLAKGVGDQEALRIYRELLSYTSDQLASVDYPVYVYYQGAIVADDMWSLDHYQKRLQVEGSLGDKLKTALAEVLEQHERVVVVGSDCPTLSSNHIQQAVDALEQHAVVLGPTFDGGYYLLGAGKAHHWLFDDIPWSSGSEFEVTVRRCIEQHASISILTPLPDIDYVEDWEQYGW